MGALWVRVAMPLKTRSKEQQQQHRVVKYDGEDERCVVRSCVARYMGR